MLKITGRFVGSIIRKGNLLKPSQMILSLIILSDSDQELEVIWYLEFCIHMLNSKMPVIHNFNFSLYVKEVQEKVFWCLESWYKDSDSMHSNINYVLRLCDEAKLKKGCILLHCMLGQLDQALELALSDSNLVQAKFCSDFSLEGGASQEDLVEDHLLCRPRQEQHEAGH